MTKSYPIFAWVLLLLLTVIWGTSFILIKEGLLALSPIQIAGLRLSVAALSLFPFWFRYYKEVKANEWLILFAIGFIGNGIPAFLFAQAETVIPSAIAGVLNSLTPIFSILIAWLAFNARFSMSRIAGILLAMAGTIILVIGTEEESKSGDVFLYSLLVVLATACYATSVNLVKYKMGDSHPFKITSISLAFAGIPGAILLFGFTDFTTVASTHPDALPAIASISALGAIGTAAALVLFNRMLLATDIVFSSSVTYLIPVVALIWGVVDGEAITALNIAGFLVILAGVWQANRKA